MSWRVVTVSPVVDVPGGDRRTARLDVRFGLPLRTGQAARVRARVVRVRGRVRETVAEVVQNGGVAATASATFLEERPDGGTRRPGAAS